MYKSLLLVLMLVTVYLSQAQTININGPAGSGQFGQTVTALANGNFVVTDPLYDEGVLINVGAVYLYNGSTHSLISTLKGSSAYDSIGNYGITQVGNGNFVVSSPAWDNGILSNAGAVTWCSGITGLSGVISAGNSLVGNSTDERLGSLVIIVLPNGNYVVRNYQWDNGTAINAGAVTWGSGTTGVSGMVSSSNSLVGSSSFDQVGVDVKVLSNGNYVVSSTSWHNGAAASVGAVTWGNGTTGTTGVVSSSNSLVGSKSGDQVGRGGITPLINGNYVVLSPDWDYDVVSTDAGAATWCNGTTGTSGVVNSSNSLVGNGINQRVGYYVTPLINGNYVVNSPDWNNMGASHAGAVTWGDGTTGISGIVSSSNSLVGSTINDRVGGGSVTVLTNGNYVVHSIYWDNGIVTDAGAATWGSGTTGVSGVITSSNSLVGSTVNDRVGNAIALGNGNYVVVSQNWTNGTASNAGAVTWGNGSTGITGTINNSNSLVGSSVNDHVGNNGITPLLNGNYLVQSSNWNNGTITNAGAVTWCNGITGTTGIVSSSNSLVGSSMDDQVGMWYYHPVLVLANGNYIVQSPYWDNGSITDAGAVTWGNGTTGITGTVNSSNSLIGASPEDEVGSVLPLSNGNYIVITSNWNNGAAADAGAVTWGNGTTGITGTVSSGNSLVGSQANDQVGFGNTVITLSNGNYVVASPYWDNGTTVDAGAVTWGKGTGGTSGPVSSSNSLVGSTTGDGVGYGVGYTIAELINGNYVVQNRNWDNGAVTDAGAVTWGNGSSGVTGTVTSCNSVTGVAATGGYLMDFDFNYVHNYLIVGRPAENMVSIYNPTGMSLANTLDNTSVNITGSTSTPLITSSGCRLIATLTPDGTSPVQGIVNAKIWIESTVPTRGDGPFVARHYEITPAANSSTATGRITLYFTQPEFDEFNAHTGSIFNLPTGETDDAGKAHLRIGKYPGTSNNGSGLPGTYSGSAEIINPADDDIVWNNNLGRWEVSFDVTGFSGLIVQTSETALPLTLLEFNGRLVNNDGVLNWKTTNEINTLSFEIERSRDGRNYLTVGTVASINQPGIHQYEFTDHNITSLGIPVVYYRLRQKDVDGRITYSRVVAIVIDNRMTTILLYPNPVNDEAHLILNVREPGQVQVRITDNTGRIINQYLWHLETGSNSFPLHVSQLSKGMYYLELKGKNIKGNIPFSKQ